MHQVPGGGAGQGLVELMKVIELIRKFEKNWWNIASMWRRPIVEVVHGAGQAGGHLQSVLPADLVEGPHLRLQGGHWDSKT